MYCALEVAKYIINKAILSRGSNSCPIQQKRETMLEKLYAIANFLVTVDGSFFWCVWILATMVGLSFDKQKSNHTIFVMTMMVLMNIASQPIIFRVLAQGNILLFALLLTAMFACVIYFLGPLMKHRQGLITLSFMDSLFAILGTTGIALGIVSGTVLGIGKIILGGA